jgi:peptidoglycan/xylan/chitin deacetylase (PgdA/CDA1 family)
MFHHFHDDIIHKRGQGSISKEQFYKIIKFIGVKNILNSNDFYCRLKEEKLKNKDVCLTFDDGLKCQIDIALPILEDLNIKSFFFVCSSIFTAKPDLLEVFRYFRNNYYDDINKFYSQFYQILDKDLKKFFYLNKKNILKKKIVFPHYSINDIKFRILRNSLSKEKYTKVMFTLFKIKKFKPEKFKNIVYFSKEDLLTLNSLGHTIGLHSHSHPTILKKLSPQSQKKEYNDNVNLLSKILKIDKSSIKCMSHPSGSYNSGTLKILINLGIKLGFKNIMNIQSQAGIKGINISDLEIPRQDHIPILKRIN